MSLPSVERDTFFCTLLSTKTLSISIDGEAITYLGKPRKYTIQPNGYKILHLSGAFISIHRLVFLAYGGAIGNFTINHIDGNKGNNSFSNLEKATHKEQMLHFLTLPKANVWKEKQSVAKSGNLNGLAKFTPEQILDIRTRPSYHGLVRDLMNEFSVSRRTIQNILNNVSYMNC
jgi:hypothetical protein